MGNKQIIINKSKLNTLIKEDPDSCYYNGKLLEYGDEDAIPFLAPINCDIVYIGYEGWTHYDLTIHLKKDNINVGKDYRGKNYWSGRFWKNSKVFSFWRLPDPNSFKKILNELSDFFEEEIDFSDYNIEISSNNFVNVLSYINGDYRDIKKNNIEKPHLLNATAKKNDSQLKNALKNKYDLIGKKLGKNDDNSREVTQAEYNFYKRYGMGESIDESPDSTNFNNERLWYIDNDAIPIIFSADLSRYLIGNPSETHGTLLNNNEDEYTPDLERDKSYHGRLWLNSKVMSFWETPSPEKLSRIITILSQKFPEEDFENYNLEIKENNFVKVKNYLSAQKEISNNFNKEIIHLMPPSKKIKSDQMKNALKSKYDLIGKKLGKKDDNSREVTQAEYNFYKRYGMGESISVKDMDFKSFEEKNTLNPKLWNNDKLNSNVRLRLLDIADDFMKECNLLWIKPKDIIITGSMAGYNWTKYSDIDLHIIIDYSKVFDDKNIVQDYFLNKKNEWSNNHKNLTIYGHLVEIFVQDLNEKLYDGIFSIEDNKWIRHPDKNDDLNIDKDKIKKIVLKYVDNIDDIDKSIKKLGIGNPNLKKYFKKLTNIMKDLKKMRNDSLKSKNNVGDIAYKILRRCGYLDKVYDLKIKSYDKAKTLY